MISYDGLYKFMLEMKGSIFLFLVLVWVWNWGWFL